MNQKQKEMEEAGISFQLLRGGRKTLALQIKADGTVLARAPYRMPEYRVRQFVREKAGWIRKNQEKAATRRRPAGEGAALSPEKRAELLTLAPEVFRARVEYFAPQIGVTYTKITIRDQKTRWGSCGGTGSLSFNFRLLLAPPEVLDYVVVHELCHRREMNHSAAFWAQVARILPDYPLRRAWLKENGWRLMD